MCKISYFQNTKEKVVTIFKTIWSQIWKAKRLNSGLQAKKQETPTYYKSGFRDYLFFLAAESEGFEPPEQLPVHRISSAARSTTPATFLKSGAKVVNYRYQQPYAHKKNTIRTKQIKPRKFSNPTFGAYYYVTSAPIALTTVPAIS